MLCPTAADFTTTLGLRGTLAALRKLPFDHLIEQMSVHFGGKNSVLHVDGADFALLTSYTGSVAIFAFMTSTRRLHPPRGLVSSTHLMSDASAPNIEQTLMRPQLKLFTSLLIDMRTTKHSVLIDACGQWYGTRYLRGCLSSNIHDFGRRPIEKLVVISLKRIRIFCVVDIFARTLRSVRANHHAI